MNSCYRYCQINVNLLDNSTPRCSKSTRLNQRSGAVLLGITLAVSSNFTASNPANDRSSWVRSLSLYGCLVKTDQSFRLGAKLMLRMTHSETNFSANGSMVNQTEVGIGVSSLRLIQSIGCVWKQCLLNWLELRRQSDPGRKALI